MEAMENALATPYVAPTPAPLVAAAVITRRRSHLDSASFRTLSRLFSHCLHLHPPPNEGSAPPDLEPAAAGPIGRDSVVVVSPEAPGVAGFDRLKDVEGEASDAGDPSLHGIVSPSRTQPAAANPTGDPVEDAGAAVVAERMSCKTSDEGEESEVGVRLAEAVVEDEALKSVEACLETEVDGAVEEAMGDDEGQLLFDAMLTDFTGLIDDVADGEIAAQSCAASEGGLQNSNVSEVLKQFGDGIEDGEPMNNSYCGQIAGGGFEEGEIEGEFQDLDSEESDSSELGDEDAEDEELGGDSITKGSVANELCDNGTGFKNLNSTPEIPGNGHLLLDQDANVRSNAQISVARAQAVSYDDVVVWNETPLPNNEAPNPEKKKKRSMTETRKATKTKNKRMKRAQERIANGVIRPKLKPLIKQKPPCRYYKYGNCQHGDSCNFSHDFTPLTKSKPCKHFACGSCLKGDQCPYDHELSKYECHNYKNNGMCSRGDKCKFSHVMQTTEGTPAPDAKTSDVSLAFEKRTLTEYTSSQKSSTVHSGGRATSASTKQQHSILKNLSGVSLNAQNISNRIPKGVQFLPFSKGVPNTSYLHPSALPIEKQRNANGSQLQHPGKHETGKQKIVKQYNHLDVKNLSTQTTVHPCSEQKKASLPIDSTGTPGSIPTQHEDSESEASKIFLEFLGNFRLRRATWTFPTEE
ncbi:hypothetical protein U9M48_018701 [Paspalum notatum var. saurae]|uniref:C3H1-type domain-containing protein n=1 Tax=Paspalum notatum var. saurae TaxID=547442 RepID=A0AAQ3TE30_PASNO